jgi:hypothetical protein
MKKFYVMGSDLRLRQTPNYKRMFLVCLVLLGASFMAMVYMSNNVQVNTHKIHTTDTVYIEDLPLTDSAITHELTRLGCMLPNVALAQFKVETGHFKSNICTENKNIAGIRNSASKLAKGISRGHNVYSTYRDCLRDYVRIQNKYLKNIDGKYAEASDYTDALKNVR